MMETQRFFETIQVLRGEPQRLELHQARVERTIRAHFSERTAPCLAAEFRLPEGLDAEVVKWRYAYGAEPCADVAQYSPYMPRKIETLRLYAVDADGFSYEYKADPPQYLSNLRARLCKSPTEDVLLVRQGCLTDMTYANIALFDGERWYTPAEPLLRGTRRAWLMAQGVLHPMAIRPADLRNFKWGVPINAMLGLDAANPSRITRFVQESLG